MSETRVTAATLVLSLPSEATKGRAAAADDVTVKKIVNVTVNKSDTARRSVVFTVPPQMRGPKK